MSSASKIITKLCTSYHMSHIISSNSKLQQSFIIRDLGHRFLSNYARVYNNTYKRKFSVHNSVQQDPPKPSKPPSSSSRWILGTLLATILPFAGNKWGSPLLKVKEDVDNVVETVEDIVEVVEKVAELVDEVAENVSDGLPVGGKLKKVVDAIEDVAEKIDEDAQIVGDAIDKFQEVERKGGEHR
ncbi:hypothetical protein CASFOL_016784 [Castilleja foliolosa]|uniref:Uncharacterized protein n=1 Tax=Castilleja foliolosa TaxID=1961234 RepID=A0ABD3DA40_9LAMI